MIINESNIIDNEAKEGYKKDRSMARERQCWKNIMICYNAVSKMPGFTVIVLHKYFPERAEMVKHNRGQLEDN